MILIKNEKKYDESMKEFNILNNSCYNDMKDIISNKYKALTPVVLRFIQVSQLFFKKMSFAFKSTGSLKYQ